MIDEDEYHARIMVGGFKAFPAWQHIIDQPMFTLPGWNHMCHLCQPECYASLAPGFTACARCGVVIFVEYEGDPRNEAMAVCEVCDEQLGEELHAADD